MAVRFYMVTFDLMNSATRTADYRAAERALNFALAPQNFWKPMKQCCVVRTDRTAS